MSGADIQTSGENSKRHKFRDIIYSPIRFLYQKLYEYQRARRRVIFAVYSMPDESLVFYSGRVNALPEVGTIYRGRIVTEIYADIGDNVSNLLELTGQLETCYEHVPERLGIDPWLTGNPFRRRIRSVKIADPIALRSTAGWFYGLVNCTKMDLRNLDTRNVVDMSLMFHGCRSLKHIDLGMLDTSSVRKFTAMFYGCEKLESLDLRSFDTGSCVDFAGMFHGCRSLKSLDVSSFDFSRAVSTAWMFAGCVSLVSLNLGDWVGCQVRNISWMFAYCVMLKAVWWRNFDGSSVQHDTGMCLQCACQIPVDGIDTDAARREAWDAYKEAHPENRGLDWSNALVDPLLGYWRFDAYSKQIRYDALLRFGHITEYLVSLGIAVRDHDDVFRAVEESGTDVSGFGYPYESWTYEEWKRKDFGFGRWLEQIRAADPYYGNPFAGEQAVGEYLLQMCPPWRKVG